MASDDGLMSYFAKIGLDASEFLNGISKADSGILQFYRDVSVSMGATAFIFDKFLQYGSMVVSKIYEVGASAQEIQDLSYSLEISTKKVQELQYAAAISGTNFGIVQQGIAKLSISVADAGDKSTAAAKAFAQLGISTDGRSLDDLFDDTARALVNMEDTTARNRIAMDLYGRSWKDLLPYMQEYIDKAREIKNNAYLSEEELKANADAKKQLDALGMRSETNLAKLLSGEGSVQGYSEKQSDKLVVGAVGGTDPFSRFIRWLNGSPAGAGSARSGDKPQISKGPDYGGYSPPEMVYPDPFAGLTLEEATIKNLRDFEIPALEDNLKTMRALQIQGKATYADIAAASLDLISAKEKLVELTNKETDAEKEHREAIENANAVLNDYISSREDLDAMYNYDLRQNIYDPTKVRELNVAHNRQEFLAERQFGKDLTAAVNGGTTITNHNTITIQTTQDIDKVLRDLEREGYWNGVQKGIPR